MFIHIEQAKSPATINLILKRMKKQEREFLPKDMLVFLRVTNHHLSIRDMLKNIPEGKEADFKEAICSAVEHREHTEANLERMREIAKIGGFEAEFEEAHAKDKWIGDTYKRTFIAKSIDDLVNNPNLSDYETVVYVTDGYKISAKADNIFIAKSNEDLENNPDLSGYGTVICDFEGYTRFADLTKLPKKMIIKGDIDWQCRDFEKLPDISESIVYGNFWCWGCNNLTSLEGAPKEVDGWFDCSKCENLKSLVGAPEKVGGYFNCSCCENLKSLEGAPKEVGGWFDCSECENLTSLEGAPEKVGGRFECSWCKNLVSLEGAPKKVGEYFDCSWCFNLKESGRYLVQDGQYYDLFNLPKDKEFVINGDLDLCERWLEELPDLSNVVVKGGFSCGCNNISDLKGSPKEVGGYFNCSCCENLKSLEGAPKEVGGDFVCTHCENLKSLEGAPKEVGGKFDCYHCNNLESLEGAPKEVGGIFDCRECYNLTSAKGLPMHIGGDIYCDDELRPEIDKELERRKQQAAQKNILIINNGNDGM